MSLNTTQKLNRIRKSQSRRESLNGSNASTLYKSTGSFRRTLPGLALSELILGYHAAEDQEDFLNSVKGAVSPFLFQTLVKAVEV